MADFIGFVSRIMFLTRINAVFGGEEASILPSQKCMRRCNIKPKRKTPLQHTVICRDISKELDEVWIEGLKYKIITITELPSITSKFLCSYNTNTTAQIEDYHYKRPKIQLQVV